MTELKEKIIDVLKEVYWEEFDYSQPEQKERSEEWFKAKANQILELVKEDV